MDTISLHQAGFDSAVASLGTSLTAEHAQLLARYLPRRRSSAYDGDGAGVVRRPAGHPPAGEGGAEGARCCGCTGAKDPDEFIKSYGREAFARLLDQSENHMDYRLRAAAERYDLTDDAQRVEFLRDAAGAAGLPGTARWSGRSMAATLAQVAGVSAGGHGPGGQAGAGPAGCSKAEEAAGAAGT